jgi:hypothetical protein
MMPYTHTQSTLNQTKCTACDCDSQELHLHFRRHRNHHLEIGCIHAEHVFAIGCADCMTLLFRARLAPAGRVLEGKERLCTLPHGRAWGWKDWGHIADGHEQTWIPLRTSADSIAYDKTHGEIIVQCPVCCQLDVRFAIAPEPDDPEARELQQLFDLEPLEPSHS